jgi:hypothetical protein
MIEREQMKMQTKMRMKKKIIKRNICVSVYISSSSSSSITPPSALGTETRCLLAACNGTPKTAPL